MAIDRRQILYLSALFCVFVFLLTFLFLTKSPDSNSFVSPSPVTKEISTKTSLSFSPLSLTTTATTSAVLDVKLEGSQDADLAQLEIGYDPNVLYNVNILPGDYFVLPKVVLYNIDIKNGRISYALQGDLNSNSTKTLAQITFNTVYADTPQETIVKFLPKTTIKKGNEEIKLNSITEAKITYQ